MKKTLKTAGFIVSQKQMALDLAMVAYDIWGTTAHVLMLVKQKIMSKEDGKKILSALVTLDNEVESGAFAIDPQKGSQLTLEGKIVEKVGDIGYKVHTGRSRNDQVMVTEMLYLRDQVLTFMHAFVPVLKALYALALKHKKTVMPGYTHMQPAKPTTLGAWALSYLAAFLRGMKHMISVFGTYNMNPLGACESYGTSWQLDRDYTTKLLGFSKPWAFPQDAISSRGFPQLGYLTALKELSLMASKLAQDLLFFDTFEFGMIGLGDEVAQRMHPITGSSVMAQKKNPDVLELIRATAPQIGGYETIVSNILSGLPMGYNRDSREVKEYIDMGLVKSTAMAKALHQVLTTIHVDSKRMLELVKANYSLTTDLADAISQKSGVGYRIVYKIVGAVVDSLINQGKLLSEITADEIMAQAKLHGVTLKITDVNIQQALDPAIAVGKRSYTTAHVRNEIDEISHWMTTMQRTIAKAKHGTKEAYEALT